MPDSPSRDGRRQRWRGPSRRASGAGCASKRLSLQRLGRALPLCRPLACRDTGCRDIAHGGPPRALCTLSLAAQRSLTGERPLVPQQPLRPRWRCRCEGDSPRPPRAPRLRPGLTLSCGDSTPTGVAAAPKPQADLIGSLLGGTGLLSCSNLPYDSTTKVIGSAGGTITAGPHSFFVPPGALSQPTTITMVQPTGDHVNAVRFQPAACSSTGPRTSQ